MRTNVDQKNVGAKLPAGIVEGTEAFWFENKKWLIHQGVVMYFNQAPTKIKNMVIEIFRYDIKSRKLLEKEGLTKFSEQFDRWYKCVIGALDETPDFVDGNLNADAYNHACTDYSCQLRGKLCSISTGLKNYEIETIVALKSGESFRQTADKLCISLSGLKSRIEKIKDKLGATNMASLIAIATQIGI